MSCPYTNPNPNPNPNSNPNTEDMDMYMDMDMDRTYINIKFDAGLIFLSPPAGLPGGGAIKN